MAHTFFNHGLPKITSKASLQLNILNMLMAAIPPTVTLPIHHPIDLILVSFTTLIHVVDGSMGSRQWLYPSQCVFEMQFLIALLSTCPVAWTTTPFSPCSCIHCKKGFVFKSGSVVAMLNISASRGVSYR